MVKGYPFVRGGLLPPPKDDLILILQFTIISNTKGRTFYHERERIVYGWRQFEVELEFKLRNYDCKAEHHSKPIQFVNSSTTQEQDLLNMVMNRCGRPRVH